MLGGNHSVLDYNHPVMVLSSVFFFLAFTRLDFQSKTVNWMAASAFAIYLIHMNFLVKQDYRALMGNLYQAFSPAAALWVMLGAVLLIALACIRTMNAPELIEAAKEKTRIRNGGKYVCPLPGSVVPPVGRY